MNLVLKTDVKKTEAALNKYKEANIDSIKANAALERNEDAAFQSRQAWEKEQAALRRQAAQQEYEDSLSQKTEENNRAFNMLAAGQSGKAKGCKLQGADPDGPVSDPTGLVKGLRRIRAPAPEKVYDPFMGMATSRDYYDLRDEYPSLRLAKAKSDTRTKAGGFDFQAYFDESLLRAFAGLGCFIDEEQAGRNQPASREVATAVAALSTPQTMPDEVF
jgi:CDK-activating kinase assembly factor MAT1